MSYDAVVVGAGLFGQIIAKRLISKGANVLVIAGQEKMSGSRPAACLMKPSWYSSLGKEVYLPAMQTLEELYSVKTIEFKTNITKTKVKWIYPPSILEAFRLEGTVSQIVFEDNEWRVLMKDDSAAAKTIIIAAGIWCNELLERSGISEKVPGLSPRTGTAFYCNKETEPEIKVWAPFRQLAKFTLHKDWSWIGDGGAFKRYTREHFIKSSKRCAEFINTSPNPNFIWRTGHRPYAENSKPCYLKEHAPNLWVVTGGAKNGTIAAGWAAHKLGEILT